MVAIATLRNIVDSSESNLFGGIFFARANDTSVNSVPDLKGKILAASSILLMGSGQTQWEEMRKHGLDLLVDSAKVQNPDITPFEYTLPVCVACVSYFPY